MVRWSRSTIELPPRSTPGSGSTAPPQAAGASPRRAQQMTSLGRFMTGRQDLHAPAYRQSSPAPQTSRGRRNTSFSVAHGRKRRRAAPASREEGSGPRSHGLREVRTYRPRPQPPLLPPLLPFPPLLPRGGGGELLPPPLLPPLLPQPPPLLPPLLPRGGGGELLPPPLLPPPLLPQPPPLLPPLSRGGGEGGLLLPPPRGRSSLSRPPLLQPPPRGGGGASSLRPWPGLLPQPPCPGG